MIVEDPTTGAQYSLKGSTNKTGGMWKDKKQTWEDAKQVRMSSDLVSERVNAFKLPNLVIMDEPVAVGVDPVDQGMIVRRLGTLPSGDHLYLPGFSALHDKVGKDIAAANGSANPAEFWNEHYNKPTAKAMAQFSAHTGLTYDSPHSQNFLIELTPDMKPTGRIVFRDFGDVYVHSSFMKASGRKDFVQKFEASNIRSDFDVAFGPLHGNTQPSWMKPADYNRWGEDFFKTFEAEFQSITGVQIADNNTRLRVSPYSYYSKTYETSSARWKPWLENADCFAGALKRRDGSPCPDVIASRRKPDSLRQPASLPRVPCVSNVTGILFSP
jgi:hypothetical protein